MLKTLDEKSLEKFININTIYVTGKPYLWIMSFGWAKIGFYIKHLSPVKILVAHCNHFGNAGKNYGRLAIEGADATCQWRYEGEVVELNTGHIIEGIPYNGLVPTGGVR